jgi:hypothetical protein
MRDREAMPRGNHIRVAWPATLLMALAVHATASVTFYCPFEGSARPQIHAGDPTPALEGEEEYVEGIQGRGLVVGDGGARVEYAAADNHDFRESTVSFWVKPLDWEGTDDKFHVFFQCSAPARGDSKGSRLLYKYLVPGRFLMRGLADAVLRVHVCAVRQQQLRQARVVEHCRPVQRRAAGVVLGVDVRTVRQ